MKVLFINSVSGLGSTGRIVEDLAKFVNLVGYESYIAYAHGHTEYVDSYKYGTCVEKKLYALITRLFGQQGLYGTYGTHELIDYIEKIRPDIIHLHNLHGNHINFPLLFSYLKRKNFPVVWTLHDCWSYTGGCTHYTNFGCYKWKEEGCSNYCPVYRAWLPDFGCDRVREIFELKKSYFTSIDKMKIIAVSNWLKNEVEKSFFSKCRIISVYNWVDTNIYKPVYGLNRAKYGIPQDKEIVLCVSAFWSKGSVRYKHAIDLSKKLPKNYCLVLIGKLNSVNEFPGSVISIPFLHDTSELVRFYSAALAYVHLSVEDTFGKVVVEAMACGTPVIVFDSTALPELLGENCGYIVNPHIVNGIISSIFKIQVNGKDFYSTNCINRVRDYFNLQYLLNQYIKIYQSMLC